MKVLSTDECLEIMDLAIDHVAKESGNDAKSLTEKFNVLVKVDKEARRYWISETAYGYLQKLPEWRLLVEQIVSKYGYFSQDEWGEGAHIRFPKDDETFSDKLDIKDIIAVLLPETVSPPITPPG
ncbi:hypothetical protein Cylst_5419 [Cylindrospermum stagnale PCC 7417]|uniref:Uncharacterized protein n=1 Tax=Cylindrospermum stagnale PCC 7417 TaxID=56107 RepID=K9X5S3_9NOST|nr:hypothetical protein [Cylindrospermum stagnale]AFZ27439.1 hypothetical protein Cylst_5419 [Cylindrospermum stagnale PCC 7417]